MIIIASIVSWLLSFYLQSYSEASPATELNLEWKNDKELDVSSWPSWMIFSVSCSTSGTCGLVHGSQGGLFLTHSCYISHWWHLSMNLNLIPQPEQMSDVSKFIFDPMFSHLPCKNICEISTEKSDYNKLHESLCLWHVISIDMHLSAWTVPTNGVSHRPTVDSLPKSPTWTLVYDGTWLAKLNNDNSWHLS